MARILTVPAIVRSSSPIGVRRIGAADLNWALRAGWRDFQVRRGELVLLALIYPAVAALTAAAAFDARILPLLFPAAAGLSLLGPAVASGFFELARRADAGLDAGWTHFLDPLRDERRWPLLALTGGLCVLFALWLGVAAALYGAIMGPGDPTLDGFVRRMFTTPGGWSLIVLGNLAGLVFAALTLVLGLVSFPLVVDKGVDPVQAVGVSLAAAIDNPVAVAGWGLRVGAILVLGALPACVGLAVAVPVLGYASWRLYTRLVAR
jgi:uncharacterized membrane protein